MRTPWARNEKRFMHRVLAQLIEAADNDGNLSEDAFIGAFQVFVPEGHGAPPVPVLRHLFALFDQDHNGSVDGNELAAGLSAGWC